MTAAVKRPIARNSGFTNINSPVPSASAVLMTSATTCGARQAGIPFEAIRMRPWHQAYTAADTPSAASRRPADPQPHAEQPEAHERAAGQQRDRARRSERQHQRRGEQQAAARAAEDEVARGAPVPAGLLPRAGSVAHGSVAHAGASVTLLSALRSHR